MWHCINIFFLPFDMSKKIRDFIFQTILHTYIEWIPHHFKFINDFKQNSNQLKPILIFAFFRFKNINGKKTREYFHIQIKYCMMIYQCTHIKSRYRIINNKFKTGKEYTNNSIKQMRFILFWIDFIVVVLFFRRGLILSK